MGSAGSQLLDLTQAEELTGRKVDAGFLAMVDATPSQIVALHDMFMVASAKAMSGADGDIRADSSAHVTGRVEAVALHRALKHGKTVPSALSRTLNSFRDGKILRFWHAFGALVVLSRSTLDCKLRILIRAWDKQWKVGGAISCSGAVEMFEDVMNGVCRVLGHPFPGKVADSVRRAFERFWMGLRSLDPSGSMNGDALVALMEKNAAIKLVCKFPWSSKKGVLQTRTAVAPTDLLSWPQAQEHAVKWSLPKRRTSIFSKWAGGGRSAADEETSGDGGGRSRNLLSQMIQGSRDVFHKRRSIATPSLSSFLKLGAPKPVAIVPPAVDPVSAISRSKRSSTELVNMMHRVKARSSLWMRPAKQQKKRRTRKSERHAENSVDTGSDEEDGASRVSMETGTRRLPDVAVVNIFQVYYYLWKHKRHSANDIMSEGVEYNSDNRIVIQILEYIDRWRVPEDSLKPAAWKSDFCRKVYRVVRDNIESCLLTEDGALTRLLEIVSLAEGCGSHVPQSDMASYHKFLKEHPAVSGQYEELRTSSVLGSADPLVVELLKPPINPQDLQPIREYFQALDTDGSGAISLEELQQDPSFQDIDFHAFDLNNNGELEFDEFVAMCCPSGCRNIRTIWMALRNKIEKRLALIRGGSIGMAHTVLLPSLPHAGVRLLEELYYLLDADGNGHLEYDEMEQQYAGVAQLLREIDPKHDFLDLQRFLVLTCPDGYKIGTQSVGTTSSEFDGALVNHHSNTRRPPPPRPRQVSGCPVPPPEEAWSSKPHDRTTKKSQAPAPKHATVVKANSRRRV
mmetsp:Transcript_36733/g.88277  ORF Transcript_36733/g.88277 Transcript_36733/m.88277 type:complete len:796 (+) Transcript_36733:112-2499(+)